MHICGVNQLVGGSYSSNFNQSAHLCFEENECLNLVPTAMLKKTMHRFNCFMEAQTYTGNVQVLEASLSLLDSRVKVENENAAEYLYGFMRELWVHDVNRFRCWLELIQDLELYGYYRCLITALFDHYRSFFRVDNTFIEALPVLYLSICVFNEFSDAFRRLTGLEWSPVDINELEVLLLGFFDYQCQLQLNRELTDLLNKMPELSAIVGDQFWHLFEGRELSFLARPMSWRLSFSHSAIRLVL